MNRNFFVRLAFATHRVADALGSGQEIAQEIREAANAVLADLILLSEKELMVGDKRQELVFGLERQVDILIVYLNRAKEGEWANPENFEVLEREYRKIREFLEMFEGGKKEEPQREEEPLPKVAESAKSAGESAGLTTRQQKILEFLKTKENAQVWELQKVLPQVTKRTLRRDLDELLQKNLVERKGEWNAVFYELK